MTDTAGTAPERARLIGDVSHLFVTWDWREQPDWAAIDIALSAVFDGTRRPGVTPVDDTGGDDYVVVVSSKPLTGAEAQRLYDERASRD